MYGAAGYQSVGRAMFYYKHQRDQTRNKKGEKTLNLLPFAVPSSAATPCSSALGLSTFWVPIHLHQTKGNTTYASPKTSYKQKKKIKWKVNDIIYQTNGIKPYTKLKQN